MKNKDNENEYIGIGAIIILVLLGVVALWYFFSHKEHVSSNSTSVPIEATPVPDTNSQ